MKFTEKIKEQLNRGREIVFAESELANQRIAICDSCEYLTGIRNCKKCGCFIDAKAKLKGASCPMDKW
jgi:hypothetical protein